jgi:hypothetical protein
MKTSELTDPALDWAVAKCNGHVDDETIIRRLEPDEEGWFIAYTTDWAQGGPIIEREEIGIKRRMPCMKGEEWEASGSPGAKGAGYSHAYGPTPLIAAMRCYVAACLGDEVDVPEELK